MTLEKAINLLDNLIGMIEDNQETDYDAAFHMAIDALKAQAERTEKRTETHACDYINRKDAIEAHYEYCNKHPDAGFPVWSLKILEDLPSAQPELETVKCIIGESCMDIGDADFSMKCAKCGAEYYHVEYYDYDYNFCPNCGRRWRKQGG